MPNSLVDLQAERSAERSGQPPLAAMGVRDVVSVPVGFVSDHVEIFFDIDHRAKGIADGLGMRLERPPALNDDPLFMDALAALVRERAEPWLEEARAA